ncbi:MAG: head-tail connector protein [Synergistaceae bacterium]|nr:head-tail connector protein [Synergistaceae bacterium]
MAELITLSEAKQHLRVLFDDDDTYITSLITAAIQYAEYYQNRVYLAKPDENIQPEEMPMLEKCACLLLIAHWYENRCAVSSEKAAREIPLGVKPLLDLRRNVPV